MRAQTNSPSSGKATAVGPGATPREVRASYALWLAAIAAALFETVLVVIEVLSGHSALSTSSVIVGIGMRLLIFSAVVYVASRICLAGGTGPASPWL
jgi:hypothetical protein